MERFRLILQNLVGNAVKFTESGSVTIRARAVDDEIRVDVCDTGIGIAAEHLPRIFEEFRQVDEGTSRKYGGTGLGLASPGKYAGLLRGSITVLSTLGKGSVFHPRIAALLHSTPDPETAAAAGFFRHP